MSWPTATPRLQYRVYRFDARRRNDSARRCLGAGKLPARSSPLRLEWRRFDSVRALRGLVDDAKQRHPARVFERGLAGFARLDEEPDSCEDGASTENPVIALTQLVAVAVQERFPQVRPRGPHTEAQTSKICDSCVQARPF